MIIYNDAMGHLDATFEPNTGTFYNDNGIIQGYFNSETGWITDHNGKHIATFDHEGNIYNDKSHFVGKYDEQTHNFHDAFGHIQGHYNPFTNSFSDNGQLLGTANDMSPEEIHNHYDSIRTHLLNQIF